MKRIVRLTESDLIKLVKRVINEATIEAEDTIPNLDYFNKNKKGFLEMEKNNETEM
jgi:hypothetical protein